MKSERKNEDNTTKTKKIRPEEVNKQPLTLLIVC